MQISRHYRAICVISFLIIIVSMPLVVYGQGETAGANYPGVYTGQIIPTADPADRFSAAAHALTFPPALALQFAAPATRWMTAMGFIGASAYPAAGYASVSLRLHLLRPRTTRRGMALQTQLLANSGSQAQEWMIAYISTAFQAIISSPIRRFRIHAGGALHTMPGRATTHGVFPSVENKYDFNNMQTSVFTRVEYSLKNEKVSFFTDGCGWPLTRKRVEIPKHWVYSVFALHFAIPG